MVLREEFLEQKRLTKKKDGTRLDKETLSAYENLMAEFLRITKAAYADELDGMDLRRYMNALEERGLSHRTICNYYTSIATFLHFCGVDHKKLLPYAERPTPDDGEPEAYSEEEVSRFLAACNSERDRLFFEFLLKTGVREMEAVFAEWPDIELDKGVWVFHVHNKPELGFRTKTGKSRKIPLEARLHEQLKLWHEMRPRTRLFWEARRIYLPAYLRLEDNPGDLGVKPEKQNHYRLTGQVIMLHEDWPCFRNDYNDRRQPLADALATR